MSRIKAGRLRHRVDIEHKVEIPDGQGAGKYVWTQFYRSVPAAVEPLSAREFIAAQGVQSQVTKRVTIRFKPDIDASMRIRHGGAIYNIEGVLEDLDSGRSYLTMPVSSGVNDG